MENEKNDTPLFMCTSEELFNELTTRLDAVVLITLKQMDDEQALACRRHGGFFTNLGMLKFAMETLDYGTGQIEYLEEDESDSEEDGELI